MSTLDFVNPALRAAPTSGMDSADPSRDAVCAIFPPHPPGTSPNVLSAMPPMPASTRDAFDLASWRLRQVPNSWFRVKYRSKAEALRMLFGVDWEVTYIPCPTANGNVLHTFLLTLPSPGQGMLQVIFANDPVSWFNPYESPTVEPEHPLCPTDTFEPGKVLLTHGLATDGAARLRRRHLAEVAMTVRFAKTYAELIRSWDPASPSIAQAPPSVDAYGFAAVARNLFEHWISVHTRYRPLACSAAELRALRMLVHLGGGGAAAAVVDGDQSATEDGVLDRGRARSDSTQ